MSETTDTCDCGGIGDEQGDESEASWRVEDSVMRARLPDDLQKALGGFLGVGEIETLDDWVREIRRRTDDPGEGIEIEDLCHADGKTAHWGEADGERYYFRCFYDAVVLSALTDSRVKIRTETPEGETVEMLADGDGGLEVEPTDAVFSFGVSEDAAFSSGGSPTHDEMYEAVCPNVKAFASYEEYESWDEDSNSVTVAAPLEGSTELAQALVE